MCIHPNTKMSFGSELGGGQGWRWFNSCPILPGQALACECRVCFLCALRTRGGCCCYFLSTPGNMWPLPLASFPEVCCLNPCTPQVGGKFGRTPPSLVCLARHRGFVCARSSGSFMRREVGVCAPGGIQTCLPQQHLDFCVGCLLSSWAFSSPSPG